MVTESLKRLVLCCSFALLSALAAQCDDYLKGHCTGNLLQISSACCSQIPIRLPVNLPLAAAVAAPSSKMAVWHLFWYKNPSGLTVTGLVAMST